MKSISILFYCLIYSSVLFAQPVSMDDAKQKALDFLCNKPTTVKDHYRAPQKLSDFQLVHQATMDNGQNAYYVFNNEKGGFVIVSGDDRAPAILGYSDVGSFDAATIPNNMKWWLEEYANQIKNIQNHGQSSSNTPISSPREAIAPMLTTKWDQHGPYNQNCPDFFGGGKCVTGCEATALAQVMYYHRAKSVTKTTYTIPAYTCGREWMIDSEPRHITVDAIPAGSPIDWDNMVDIYHGSYYGLETPEQEQAVANLMKYCGAAIEMDYATGQSDAKMYLIPIALKSYFNYKNDTELRWRYDTPDDEWENLIYNELSNNRPVLYHGMRSSESGDGHVFVCDGYDGTGYYHFNWGWGGWNDGFFLLSAIDERYPLDQAALINAEPRDKIPSGTGITFADGTVRLLCLQNWDTNDDGELTMEEAAAVTDIGTVFCNQSITSFDELQYFTGLTSIGNHAFLGCRGLTSVTVPNSVTSIGYFAFEGCSSLTQPIFNSTLFAYMPESYQGDYAIPNGIKIICGGAFAKCSGLTSVTIPNSVTNISGYAFRNCNGLTSVEIPNGVTIIGEFAFANCGGLTSVTIPNSVTNISDYAFSECNGLMSIIIPDGVTNIGWCTFGGCSSLQSVTVPNSVISIGKYAFQKCNDLKLVSINNNSIVSANRTYDSSLKTIFGDQVENYILGDDITNIGDYAFYCCSNLKSIIIPNCVTNIGEWAFLNCSSLESITIPNNVTTIGDYAYKGCSGLTSVTFSNSITTIGEEAFAGCNGLTSLSIPNSVTSIGFRAFAECSGLTSVIINSNNILSSSSSMINIFGNQVEDYILGDDVTSIGDYAFFYCSGLKSITIPSTLESIGGYAFQNCSSMTSIIIPKSITDIGRSAFKDCTAMEKITCSAIMPPSCNNSVFDGIDISSCLLQIPKGCKGSYQQAKGWKDFLLIEEIVMYPMVIADNKRRKYGEENPELTYIVTDGELTGIPELTTTATKTSPVGTYPIIVNKGTITDDYVSTNGTLTIEKAPLKITARDYTIKQGEALPTFEATYEGFKNDETEAVLTKQPTITTTATSASEPGEYDIIVSGAEAQNYDISYINGKLTIVDADALIITAKSYTIKYGDDIPAFDYTSDGAAVEGTPSITCEATKTSPVGTYPIVISKGSVSNYNVTYVNGTLTIEKAPLKITAKDYTIKQGDALPTFEATYEGFKNNETAAVLTTQPTFSTTATSASDPGDYEITVSGAEAQNYDISYANGKLTIEEASGILGISIDRPADVYDLQGNKIRSKITSLSGLSKGVYIINGKKVMIK